MSAEPLAPLLAKLKRANERLNALNRQLARFADSHPAIVATKLDFQTGWHTSYIRKIELPPARFALPVGESLYHGRSVLDHLIWALVKANGQTPGRHNEFPIRDKPLGARRGEGSRDAFLRVMLNEDPKRLGKLVGVNGDAATLIEGLQPYNRGDKATYYLAVLNKMAQEDRHHALHASRVLLGERENLRVRLAVPHGVAITDWEPLFTVGKRLKPRTKLVRFRLSQYGRKPKVGVETDIPTPIAFGDSLVTLDGLHEINRSLADLLRSFEEFL
jgi:hypothetical protein